MIKLPDKCPRGYPEEKCSPISQIVSDYGKSFICCGMNELSQKQEFLWSEDVITHCWKNSEIDEESVWNVCDLVDTMSVMAQALSVFWHDIDNQEAEDDG